MFRETLIPRRATRAPLGARPRTRASHPVPAPRATPRALAAPRLLTPLDSTVAGRLSGASPGVPPADCVAQADGHP